MHSSRPERNTSATARRHPPVTIAQRQLWHAPRDTSAVRHPSITGSGEARAAVNGLVVAALSVTLSLKPCAPDDVSISQPKYNLRNSACEANKAAGPLPGRTFLAFPIATGVVQGAVAGGDALYSVLPGSVNVIGATGGAVVGGGAPFSVLPGSLNVNGSAVGDDNAPDLVLPGTAVPKRVVRGSVAAESPAAAADFTLTVIASIVSVMTWFLVAFNRTVALSSAPSDGTTPPSEFVVLHISRMMDETAPLSSAAFCPSTCETIFARSESARDTHVLSLFSAMHSRSVVTESATTEDIVASNGSTKIPSITSAANCQCT
eukprot:Opistho-2@75128